MKNRISKYQVDVTTGPREGGPRVEIRLLADGGSTAGRLLFHDPGDEIPNDGTHRDGKTPLLHLPYHAYEGVIDLLRNEAPVFIEMGGLSTEQEAIGEAE